MRQTSLNMVYELAKEDSRVVFIGSDLGPGVLNDFKENIPERFMMEGVAEQFIMGFSAGLAKEGFIPYVNTIATFITRRCFEQLSLDLALHKLPVKFIGNGGGLVYAPLGPTHQAIDDISIVKSIPNMTVVAPCDANEMRLLMRESLDWPDPMYIRLARGGEKIVTPENYNFRIGKSIMLKDPTDSIFITCGAMAQNALEAARKNEKEKNIKVGVLHMPTIQPIDRESLRKIIPKMNTIVTVEEHIIQGGFGSTILEFINDELEVPKKITRVGLNHSFVDKYGTQDELQSYYGLDSSSLAKIMIREINES